MGKRHILFVLALPIAAAAARREPTASAVTTQLQESFYNIFVHDYVDMLVFTGSEGVLLVDSGMEPVELIAEELEKIGGGKVKYIINTHPNGDHVNGNTVLGGDAVVIASEACREHLEKRDGYPGDGLPSLTFEDSLRIHFNGEEINLYFLPGHTDSDIAVYFKKAKIVCLGDLVFPDSFPGIQAGNGGDVFTIEESIGRVGSMFPEDALFHNSHGRDYGMADLRDYHRMIRETIDAVMPYLEDGHSLKKIKRKKPLMAWREWESAFFPGEITMDTWIENICESVEMQGEDSEFPRIQGPYLGQTPPGMTPELFAPGIVTTAHHEHSSPTFSPDGKSVYWSVVWTPFGQGKPHTILYSILEKEGWCRPRVAPFSGDYGDDGPRFAPDGDGLYFYSRRPRKRSSADEEWHNIWFVENIKNGWSQPRALGSTINTDAIETSASITRDGTLYFMRGVNEPEVQYDLYRSRSTHRGYSEPEKLDERINSSCHDYTPFIAPDESYFLFSSVNRPDGFGSGDLYVCFMREDGTWSDPQNLGENVNTRFNERFPSVSHDGKYLFFVSNFSKEENAGNSDLPQNGYCDIYWVDAKIIEESRPNGLK